jgi:hypothetical protein
MPAADELDIRTRREYTESDLQGYNYLEILAGPAWGGQVFEPGGPLELDIDGRMIRRDSCGVDFRIVVVQDQVKQALEDAGLEHVVFKPTILSDAFQPPFPVADRRRVTWQEIGEPPWWELSSGVLLPRLAPGVELVDNNGDPFVEGTSKGCWMIEDLFDYPELHYMESDIRRVEPFDCGLTLELLGRNSREANRIRVISQRFYRTCRDRGFVLNCVPVHLVDS